MYVFRKGLLFLILLTMVSISFGVTHQLQGSAEVKEILFPGTEEECVFEVELYENDLVDVVAQTINGNVLFFHSEMTKYGCEISYEPFAINDMQGVMLLLRICNGGNYNPYESLCVFISEEQEVYNSMTPTECRSQGGPGPYYPNMIDVNGDSVFDHFAYPKYLFYLPNESQARNRQLQLNFLKLPYINAEGELGFEDNTLEILINPESQSFRNEWINSMSEWLVESAELCQSNPSMLEIRGSVWALREALSSDNYQTFSELYAEL